MYTTYIKIEAPELVGVGVGWRQGDNLVYGLPDNHDTKSSSSIIPIMPHFLPS